MTTPSANGRRSWGDTDPDERFKGIWLYCMLDHEVGTLPSGPCLDCVKRYTTVRPPDGRWNREEVGHVG